MTLGAAIRAARGDLRQEELAVKLRKNQTTVSNWERDQTRPSLEEVALIEQAAGKPRGWILVQAGCVELPDPTSVVELIALDPALDDRGRRSLEALYREVTRG